MGYKQLTAGAASEHRQVYCIACEASRISVCICLFVKKKFIIDLETIPLTL